MESNSVYSLLCQSLTQHYSLEIQFMFLCVSVVYSFLLLSNIPGMTISQFLKKSISLFWVVSSFWLLQVNCC